MRDVNVIFLLLALFAEVIGTIGGFGSSVFFVPLGNFYFDFYSVLGLTAIFHLSSNVSKIFLFNQGFAHLSQGLGRGDDRAYVQGCQVSHQWCVLHL